MIIPGAFKKTEGKVREFMSTIWGNKGRLHGRLSSGNVLANATRTSLDLDRNLYSMMQDYGSVTGLVWSVQSELFSRPQSKTFSESDWDNVHEMSAVEGNDVYDFVTKAVAGVPSLPDIILLQQGDVAAVMGPYYTFEKEENQRKLLVSAPQLVVRLRITGDARIEDPARTGSDVKKKHHRDLIAIKSKLDRALVATGVQPQWMPGGSIAFFGQISVHEHAVNWKPFVQRTAAEWRDLLSSSVSLYCDVTRIGKCDNDPGV